MWESVGVCSIARVASYRRDERVIGGHKAEATSGDLEDGGGGR